MADCGDEKADNKRQHDDNVDHAYCKRKRSNSSMQLLKIIDLSNECLERIFKRLNLRSLFNIAIANEWLRPTASYVYKQNFGAFTVIVCAHSTPANSDSRCFPRLIKGNDYISVNGLKTCLLYLRCFGASINDLDIRYNGQNMVKPIEYLQEYVNTYCTENLVRISFSAMPTTVIEHFCKPFVNVEEVNVHGSELAQQFADFPKWFPNVRRLKLSRTSVDHRFSGVTFQHLNHLDFDFKKFDGFLALSETSAGYLLRSNRQLHSLHVSAIPEHGEDILIMIKDHKLISELVIWPNSDQPLVANALQMQRIVNEHSGLIVLDLVNFKLTADTAVALVRQLNSLKSFRFKIKNSLEYEHLKKQSRKEWQSDFDQIFNLITMTRRT